MKDKIYLNELKAERNRFKAQIAAIDEAILAYEQFDSLACIVHVKPDVFEWLTQR